jgi:hypothetical protein
VKSAEKIIQETNNNNGRMDVFGEKKNSKRKAEYNYVQKEEKKKRVHYW